MGDGMKYLPEDLENAIREYSAAFSGEMLGGTILSQKVRRDPQSGNARYVISIFNEATNVVHAVNISKCDELVNAWLEGTDFRQSFILLRGGFRIFNGKFYFTNPELIYSELLSVKG